VSILFLLIPLSILFASGFLAAFIWAVRSGQYEDTTTPSMRILWDDPREHPTALESRNNPHQRKNVP
jgi:cbb3-type cytochrome oxidase maturation protein